MSQNLKTKCNLEKSKTFFCEIGPLGASQSVDKTFLKSIEFCDKIQNEEKSCCTFNFPKIQFLMDSGFHLGGFTALFIFSEHSVIQELLLLQIHKNLHGELQIVPIYPPCQMK